MAAALVPCDHTRVGLLSAVVEKRTRASFYLMESGVCRDCGATVTRETVMRPANAWATVASGAAALPAQRTGDALYLCVAARQTG